MSSRDQMLRVVQQEAIGHEPIVLDKAEFFGEARMFVPAKLGTRIEQEGQLRIGPDGEPWRYVDGVYRPDGPDFIAQRVRDHLGDEFRANRLREVQAWCRANTDSRLPAEPATDFINVANGLLYWKEDPPRLENHTSQVGSVIQIPAPWDPTADCPAIRDFLFRVLPKDDDTYRFIHEWIGYCLIPSQRQKRALMLLGPSDTGKSTLLAVIQSLLGPSNVSNATLQSIAEDRFSAATLYGKLANIAADLDARSMASTGLFKMMTGGEDRIQADRKYRDHISFAPTARLMFSANEAPGTADQSDAFYSRWLILPMTTQVPARKQDRNLMDGLAAPAELSGLLRYSVMGLRDLWRRGRFVPSRVMLAAAEEYRRRTDTVLGHAAERLVFEPEARVRTSDLYTSYRDWCSVSGRHPLGKERHQEQFVTSFRGQVELKHRYHGYPTWAGVRLGTRADRDEHEEGDEG